MDYDRNVIMNPWIKNEEDYVKLLEIVTKQGCPLIDEIDGLTVHDNPCDAVADAAIYGVGWYRTVFP